MTIEIRQLLIRAEVSPAEPPRAAASSRLRENDGSPWENPRADGDPDRQVWRQEEIVEACVRQVLRRLERHRDR
jgi:hypothetical protein